MPVRAEHRAFFASAEWRAIRETILARDGRACQRCAKPDRELVAVRRDGSGRWSLDLVHALGRYNVAVAMTIRTCRDAIARRDWKVIRWFDGTGARTPAPAAGPVFLIRCVVTIAHLNHDSTDHADSNLAALCQRCHLAHDRQQHLANARRTRATRAGQAWILPELAARI